MEFSMKIFNKVITLSLFLAAASLAASSAKDECKDHKAKPFEVLGINDDESIIIRFNQLVDALLANDESEFDHLADADSQAAISMCDPYLRKTLLLLAAMRNQHGIVKKI